MRKIFVVGNTLRSLGTKLAGIAAAAFVMYRSEEKSSFSSPSSRRMIAQIVGAPARPVTFSPLMRLMISYG